MNKYRKSLFHIAKRDSISLKKAWAVRIAALLFALAACGVFIFIVTGMNPLEIYKGIIDGAVGNKRRTWITVREIIVLLCVSLGLAPAFKMKFWNIGAEGQILMGGTAAAALMIYAGNSIPGPLLIILIIVSAILAGMVWGLIPAFFKAEFNTNETLFTLMLNYAAIQLVNFFIVFWENPKGSNTVGIINAGSKAGWFPQIFGTAYGLNLIFAIILTFGMYIFMKKSRLGYEISVVGESVDTAEYAGINVKKVILKTMAVSGAVCGFAGALIVSGASHTISTSTSGGIGFTAIIVAWMAKFNPFGMILVSGIITFMDQGAVQIATQFGLNENASAIITGIILLFLIGSEFFLKYRIKFVKKEEA